MAQPSDKIWQAATRIAYVWVNDPEFCLVYEDEECSEWSEEDQKAVHEILRRVRPSFD